MLLHLHNLAVPNRALTMPDAVVYCTASLLFDLLQQHVLPLPFSGCFFQPATALGFPPLAQYSSLWAHSSLQMLGHKPSTSVSTVV